MYFHQVHCTFQPKVKAIFTGDQNVKLINDNTPGPSGITPHLIQNLPTNYYVELRTIFNYIIST